MASQACLVLTPRLASALRACSHWRVELGRAASRARNPTACLHHCCDCRRRAQPQYGARRFVAAAFAIDRAAASHHHGSMLRHLTLRHPARGSPRPVAGESRARRGAALAAAGGAVSACNTRVRRPTPSLITRSGAPPLWAGRRPQASLTRCCATFCASAHRCLRRRRSTTVAVMRIRIGGYPSCANSIHDISQTF